MKIVIIFTFLFIVLNLAAQVNGDTLTVDEKKILRIWGSHFERGYAYGYLMGEQIREIAVEYFIGSFLTNSIITYNYCRGYFEDNFTIEAKYETEAQAMVEGMTAAGTNMFITVLNKDIDATDILMANSLVDLSVLYLINNADQFGCSSLTAWGASTENDDELNGELLITRNMDWNPHPTLIDNHLLIVNIPTEENEIAWISFSFAGMIGGLSGINSNGTAAFMNVGNVHAQSNFEDLHPIFLSVRNGLENYDYNNDGENNEQDIVSSVSEHTHLSGSIVHAVHGLQAEIIESNNQLGSVTRNSSDNSVIPDNNLVATNHFRALYDPVYCYRYNNFADSLNSGIEQSIFRNWDITTGAGGVSTNLHTIQFVPSLELIKWSTASTGNPAYTLQPTEFNMEELFTVNTSSGSEIIKDAGVVISYPNPFMGGTQFSFSLADNIKADLTIYNIKGQKIRTLLKGEFINGERTIFWEGKDDAGQQVVSGIYFYILRSDDLVDSGRLIILK